jgi:hypothetical protein
VNPLRRHRRIRRSRKGVEISLGAEERDLVKRLVPQLRELLVGGEDPTLRRLFPTAYPDDPTRDGEYQSLVHDSLLEGRLAALETLETTVEARVITDAQLSAWMGAINDLRLVLGTRLDVAENDHDIDPDDPDATARLVYQYLGLLLEEVVATMFETLPPTPADE